MTGNDLDVNVHPRKLEVRFARGAEVYDGIFEAVHSALAHRELIPVVPAGKEEREKKAVPVNRAQFLSPLKKPQARAGKKRNTIWKHGRSAV